MNKFFSILALTIIFSGTIFAAKDVLPYKTNVNIDGVNQEWGARLPRFNKNSGINYDIANDENNLYLILRIADEKIQQDITKNGMVVWINSNGKKKKTTGIAFPLPATKKPVSDKLNMLKQLAQGNAQNAPLFNNEVTLIGFLKDNGKQPTESCPVRVSILKDKSNCLTYELAIPFNSFYKEKLDQNDAKIKFCIGFTIKGGLIEDEDTETQRNVTPAYTNRSANMGRAGNMGGAGNMGSMGSMGNTNGFGDVSSQKITTPDKNVWFNVFLNVK